GALEIGTHQGVSAARIAGALAPDGILYCVDPWPVTEKRGTNPCWSICQRHLRHSGAENRIRILRGSSRAMASQVPEQLDFAFVDGDSFMGRYQDLLDDWRERVSGTGIPVCILKR